MPAAPEPGIFPAARGPAPPRERRWNALTEEIARCRACPLHAGRRHVVVFRGSLGARVLFVGEAPGAREDAAGVPFVGAAGRRLDRAIALLGLAPGEVGVLNLIKCRPEGNRFDRRAAEACRPFLVRQLALLAPEWVVPLGAQPLAYFDPTAPRILLAAGHPRSFAGLRIFPMLHPAAPLHNPSLRSRWEEDVRRFAAVLAQAPRESLIPTAGV